MPVLAKLPHDGELIDEAFFAVFAIEAALLREGLDCELGLVSNPFDFIDGGEVAFS